jgi:hypothetical protein
MALIGINTYETKDYISKYDPDENNPTVFKIGLLDAQIKGWVMDKISDFEMSSLNPDDKAKVTFRINQRNLELVRFAVKDIVNLIDPQTKQPVKFDTISTPMFGRNYNIVSDRILSMLPLEVITELAEEILKEIGLTEEEQKN